MEIDRMIDLSVYCLDEGYKITDNNISQLWLRLIARYCFGFNYNAGDKLTAPNAPTNLERLPRASGALNKKQAFYLMRNCTLASNTPATASPIE
jgi:hypothetical protein